MKNCKINLENTIKMLNSNVTSEAPVISRICTGEIQISDQINDQPSKTSAWLIVPLSLASFIRASSSAQ